MADERTPRQFTDHTRQQLLLKRVVVLDGPLDDDNGTLLAIQLLNLAAEDSEHDISFWINSPGGSVSAMLAIRDVMRLLPCASRRLVESFTAVGTHPSELAAERVAPEPFRAGVRWRDPFLTHTASQSAIENGRITVPLRAERVAGRAGGACERGGLR